jgi:anti-sigma regulatory factor (Ser/Thr protein kinase)
MDQLKRLDTRLSLEVSEDESGVYLARHLVRRLLEVRQVDRDKIDDCLLVVGELASNVALHAHSHAGFFSLAVQCDRETALFCVTDYGRGFDPAAVPPAGAVRDGGRVGGFGIPLVKTLSRYARWRCSAQGTVAEVEVGLAPAPLEPLPDTSFLEGLDLSGEDAGWLMGQAGSGL